MTWERRRRVADDADFDGGPGAPTNGGTCATTATAVGGSVGEGVVVAIGVEERAVGPLDVGVPLSPSSTHAVSAWSPSGVAAPTMPVRPRAASS